MMLKEAFSLLGPWKTLFEFDGETYGGDYFAASDPRLSEFKREFPSTNRILELGCLEGGHTVELAAEYGSVVAVDSRAGNVRKARWAAGIARRKNVTFLCGNLETMDLEPLGLFDICFNVGLLYHLPEPWTLLNRLSRTCREMFLWTHYSNEDSHSRGGYSGSLRGEFGFADPLSGMSPESFWPTKPELLRMLADTGFRDVQLLADVNTPHGPSCTLRCRSRYLSRTLSIVIPTIGRDSLAQTIRSLVHQLACGDEIVVVADGPQSSIRQLIRELDCHAVKYCEHFDPQSTYGNAQRNYGASQAVGELLWFCDDDDVAMPWAVASIRDGMRLEGPAIFRMEYGGSELWRSPEIRVGNIGGPMVVVPRLEFKEFPVPADKPEASDFEWIGRVTSDGFRWIDDVIYRCVQHHGGKK
jgi:SAM-dependent methyltransferase